MSGEVPDGWQTVTLRDHMELVPGFAFKSDDFSNDPVDRLPLIRIRDLTSQEPVVYVPRAVEARYLVRRGDFLVGMDGEFQAVRWSAADAALNQRVLKFFSSSPHLDSEFLFYRLQPELARLEQVISATTVKHLSTKHLHGLEIPLPPLAEQRRIAEILSSVNEAIQATQAVIEQTRKVKEGVLHRLLTKGIGHTRFKQTEIGEIPEHWKLLNLGSLLAEVDPAMRSGPFGSALLKEELVEEGIPLLGIDNVHIERFDRRFKRFVTPQKYQQLRRYSVRPNDVMITIMGTVGRCCVVPDDVGPALSSKHVWTLTFDDARYLPDLLCWQLNFAPWALREFMRSAQGGVMSAINSSVLRGVRVPVPPMSEQRHIHAVLMSFNNTIAAEEERLIALNASKAALMADLLTGRRRVSTNLLLAAE